MLIKFLKKILWSLFLIYLLEIIEPGLWQLLYLHRYLSFVVLFIFPNNSVFPAEWWLPSAESSTQSFHNSTSFY